MLVCGDDVGGNFDVHFQDDHPTAPNKSVLDMNNGTWRMQTAHVRPPMENSPTVCHQTDDGLCSSNISFSQILLVADSED
ncbi:hypothetical protein T11_14288 [Trichinella zimbabwensis]|uniref:Uncharacterized protein n=1 Tax=Trichinella zimbabwensis TaxID=268475 RepID=A0A0V1H499_9BILA|nr:hypothetical protein T11_14288 [Trichinella zimbabwensis]